VSIVVEHLTKRYGATTVLSDLSFEVRPGVVTGFLGPNGAGKSTTMRCMVGLDRPDAGRVTFDGRPYPSMDRPLEQIGVLLDASYVHPARSARNHLLWMAAASGIPRARVDAVLELVGLASAARTPIKAFSLGMKQRLGLAGVLLGDPHTVILDEPGNGLDPEGIRWIRDVLVQLAAEGRTVLVSSHLLAEMALMASELVVIGKGQLVDVCSVEDFLVRYGDHHTRVVSPRVDELATALREQGADVAPVDDVTVTVRAATSAEIGDLAARLGVPLHQLVDQAASLEDSFLETTAEVRQYRSGAV
jgi:ABC-2 type transport system ATP-binding protein